MSDEIHVSEVRHGRANQPLLGTKQPRSRSSTARMRPFRRGDAPSCGAQTIFLTHERPSCPRKPRSPRSRSYPPARMSAPANASRIRSFILHPARPTSSSAGTRRERSARVRARGWQTQAFRFLKPADQAGLLGRRRRSQSRQRSRGLGLAVGWNRQRAGELRPAARREPAASRPGAPSS